MYLLTVSKGLEELVEFQCSIVLGKLIKWRIN
jgi:hypothetical protein